MVAAVVPIWIGGEKILTSNFLKKQIGYSVKAVEEVWVVAMWSKGPILNERRFVKKVIEDMVK
jgi:hypothetical protein